MPRLRIRDGPNRGMVYPVGRDCVTLGRETDCNIQVLDKGASRYHAEIFRVGEMCFIRDMGSRNGTYVNDERIQEEHLREGDRIVVGSTSLVFESDPAPGQARDIVFVDGREQDLSSHTLELRLDDLAGLEEEEADVGQDASNLRTIYQLGRMLSAESNFESAMDKALSFLAEVAPADQIYLFSVDEVTGALAPKARFERDPSVQAQVSRTIMNRAISENRSILTTDAMSDARFKSTDSIVLRRIRAVICVPMLSKGSVNGVLYLTGGVSGQPLNERHLEVATATGALISLTLQGLEAGRRQREMFFGAVRTLVGLTEARSASTLGHSERVANFAYAIAGQLGMTERARATVQLAALIHDIGKAGIPESAMKSKDSRILKKGDAAAEHVAFGSRIARNIPGAEEVAPAVLHHHENFDGSGYPKGISGDAIPIYARIIAAADMLDHFVRRGGADGGTSRIEEAVASLQQNSGRELDPEIVRACAAAHKAGSIGESRTIFEPEDSIDVR